MTHPRDREQVTPIAKGEERGAPRCETTGELKRNCSCKPCVGRRSRRGGMRKQRIAQKLLGVPDAHYHGQNAEEANWRDVFLDEVKSGAGDCNPVATRFRNMREQAEAKRAIGDSRPFRATVMPPGWGNEGIVMVTTTTWARHIAPLIAEHGGIA